MRRLPRSRPCRMASSTSARGGLSLSRLGPTWPTALASASVWHCWQMRPNSSRPCSWAAVSLILACPARSELWLSAMTTAGIAMPNPRYSAASTMTKTRRAGRLRSARSWARARRGPPPRAMRKIVMPTTIQIAMKPTAMARARYRLGWRQRRGWGGSPPCRGGVRGRPAGATVRVMAPSRLFADRADAGRRLADILPPLDGDVLVLGLARGGVPVAAEVARALGAPLDVLVVRKVGHPLQPEYALGAVSEDGIALPDDLPEAMVQPQLERARRQAQELRGPRARAPIEGRCAVVVDDGLATGRSMEVALTTVAEHRAARVGMAVPVAAGPGL